MNQATSDETVVSIHSSANIELSSKECAKECKNEPYRYRLPVERVAVTHKFTIAGHEGYLTVGQYENGSPGEIFVIMSKEGSFISGLIDSWAVLFSIALQYGAPLELLVDKMIGNCYEPQGFTSNPDIRMAKSVTDYICRWLKLKYIDI